MRAALPFTTGPCNLQVGRAELDETWGYVAKKQRKVTKSDSTEVGDQYVFIGMDGTNKAIVSYEIGKRDVATTDIFIRDLRSRIINRPIINTDAFVTYPAPSRSISALASTTARSSRNTRATPTRPTNAVIRRA